MDLYRFIIALAAFGFALAVLQGGAIAQGEVGRGQAYAEKNCGRCHALGREGDSPLEKAPPFRTLGDKWPVEYLAEALAEGIVTGHADMPEFVLNPQEIDDFLAYLKSLQLK